MTNPKALHPNRARILCPLMIQIFYETFQDVYNQEEYQPTNIWNVDFLRYFVMKALFTMYNIKSSHNYKNYRKKIIFVKFENLILGN